MRDGEALHIAQRIANIWRSTPSIAEWADLLHELDYGHATAALKDLRVHQATGLTLHAFMTEYRRRAEEAREDLPPGRCEQCDGTGYDSFRERFLVIGTDTEVETGHATVYAVPVLCLCSEGHRAARQERHRSLIRRGWQRTAGPATGHDHPARSRPGAARLSRAGASPHG